MNQPRDELLERYADAVAQDPRRPSERVRNAACAHAQLLHDQTAAMLPAKNGAAARPAANQPQWTLSLVASLAVVGLAGLMYLQIDRSTQQDREIAMGAAAPSPTNPATAVATHQEKSANPVVPPPKVATQTGASKATEQFADASARVDAKREVRAESSGRMAQSNRSTALTPATPPVMAAPPAYSAPAPAPSPAPATAKDVAPTAIPLLDAARTGNTTALQELLAQGAPINARDDNGNTALMLAVRYRHATTVRKLLDLGADTGLLNHEGLTALQIAQQMGFADIAETLLR
ncbi:MAG: ankyrin repeat domain-containing protein [Rhodoferax sp.]